MNPKDRIQEIEQLMTAADFWTDKDKAQALIKELQECKDEVEGIGKYDRNDVVLSVFAGAGGDDAEDFARMLFIMYQKFASSKNWDTFVLHEHQNDHGGYRNVSMEISGKNVYGTLKHEAGVHRLVRLSPFNSKQQRHTSFAYIDVVPKLDKIGSVDIPEDDLDVQFAKSSGPGGQNVNKRETSVRIVHKPTNVAVHVDSERSQQQNRERAMEMLRGKLFKLLEEHQKEELSDLSGLSETQIEWGNQIRSYVLHPYKLVKDHRTDTEHRDPDAVLDGELDTFIDSMKNLE